MRPRDAHKSIDVAPLRDGRVPSPDGQQRLVSPGSRELQDRFDSRRIADRLTQVTLHDRFTSGDRAFVERASMFFALSVVLCGHFGSFRHSPLGGDATTGNSPVSG